jgi:hypothetical protein
MHSWERTLLQDRPRNPPTSSHLDSIKVPHRRRFVGPRVQKRRNGSGIRWMAWCAGLAISLSIPALCGFAQSPSDGAQRKRLRQRFILRQDPPATIPASAGNIAQSKRSNDETSPVGQVTKPGDSKLTDVGRSTVTPQSVRSDQENQPPITVATQDERNQKIAADWKDPWLVFYVTGNQYGYLEPCGCTGLENQKGGVNRRDTLLTNLRQRGWNVIPIDGGNQVRRDGTQSEIKFHWTTQALRAMDYTAVAYGEKDLQLSDNILVSILDPTGSNSLFVSANVSLLPDFDLQYKIVPVVDSKGTEHRIGITSVLGDEYTKELKQLNKGHVSVTPAIASLRTIAKKLDEEKCDYQVLIAHANLDETREIVKAVPQFDLVLTSGGYGEPTYRPEVLPGIKSEIVQAGTKGMYAGIVGLFNDPSQPTRYQRIALSSQFQDSPRMMELFGKYQDELKAKADNHFSSLGLRPLSHPTMREFVGSEKCGECHTTAFEIWKNTPHAHATDSIVEPPERSMARHFDPECISCHVTGWNPQQVYPYRTGFESLEKSSHLIGNGCENCHGPGSQHVEAELGDTTQDRQLLESLRAQMRITLEHAQDKCLECHDIDNSPEFHKPGAFESYWDQVKHEGKD